MSDPIDLDFFTKDTAATDPTDPIDPTDESYSDLCHETNFYYKH